MINKRIFIITFILLCSLYNLVYSQAHLSFGYNGVVHQDTVSHGDTLFFSFWVLNTGNAPLNDSIQLKVLSFAYLPKCLWNVMVGIVSWHILSC